MRTYYYDEYLNVYFSKLEDSTKDGIWSRKKKSNKKFEKKMLRSKYTTGHCSTLDRTRKREWKRNHEPKGGCIIFDENILEDEICTREKESEIEEIQENHKSKCDCKTLIYDIRDGMFVVEGEPPQISPMIQPEDINSTTNGEFCFDIPGELQIEILSRLPSKSLARFKCVSKGWKLIILNIVPVAKAPKLLILSRTENNSLLFHSLDNEAHVEKEYNPIDEHLQCDYKIKAHSSCHGLLLVQIDIDLFVWNPLTKFFKKVFREYDLDYKNVLADLCFDSSNDEYNVVLVRKYQSYYSNSEDFFIGTCSTSTWVRIHVPDIVKNVSKGPFFKGYRHYTCKGRFPTSDEIYNNSFIPPKQFIVYFDPGKSTFIEVPAPQPKSGNHAILRDTFISLGVIDGCLCITRWFKSWGSNIEFLVMKEYGNGSSWELMFFISDLPEFFCYGEMEPLFRTKEGVLFKTSMCYGSLGVKVCDADRNFLKDILTWTKNGSFDVVLYEESCDDCERFFPDNLIIKPHRIVTNDCSYLPWVTNGQVNILNHDYSDRSWGIKDRESTDFDLIEKYAFAEDQHYLWEKKRSRNKKAKKSHCTKIPTKRYKENPHWRVLNKIQRSKKKRKGNKTKCKPKLGYLDIYDFILETRL